MENYVPVASFPSEMEALMAQATLSAGSIESFLQFEDAGGMLPVLDQSLGVQLLVDPKNLEEAKDLLSKSAHPPAETDEHGGES
jgi:hypothetical protein